jgi:deoxyuridine 5'-triphosphate nucleotidohydrolase
MNNKIQLKFFKLWPTAVLPKKNYPTDAAFDLYYGGELPITLAPGDQYIFPTGLSCIIPEGYWACFRERSGRASKGIKLSAGVIDSSYTGHWKVILLNTSKDFIKFDPGAAICQFTVEKVIPSEIFFIDEDLFSLEAENKDRKEKGFGSSDHVNQ